MRSAELARAVGDVVAGRVRADEPLARHTSFRIGGPADVLATPDTALELAAIARAAARPARRSTILGGGSNMLVGDGGIRGVVVKLGRGFRRVVWDAPCVEAGAAVSSDASRATPRSAGSPGSSTPRAFPARSAARSS
jgi:UDP-N-acetylmuramate dehydrogenase